MSDPQWLASAGAGIVALLAGAGSAWSALQSKKARQSADEAPKKETIDELSKQIALLRQEVGQIDSKLRDGRDRMARIEARLDKTATDEEFQAFVAASNEQIRGLTEKVGRLTGILETIAERSR